MQREPADAGSMQDSQVFRVYRQVERAFELDRCDHQQRWRR
jgi:hypothetical protein